MGHGYATCAECADFPEPSDCRKYDNFIARLFGWVFRSNRRAGVLRIRQVGREQFADEMAAAGRHSLPR